MKTRFCLLFGVLLWGAHLFAEQIPVYDVETQPLAAQAKRLITAMDLLGEPFDAKTKAELAKAAKAEDGAADLQRILDRHVLFLVHINPEARVKVRQGPAKPVLVEAGWRQYLVKVHNEAGTTAAMRVVSPNARSVHDSRWAQNESDRRLNKKPVKFDAAALRDRWLDLQTYDKQPLAPALGGLEVEYRIVQLYSRDAGKREAKFSFDVGQGTQDLGFRNEVDVLFTAAPAFPVTLRVQDENGKPTIAAFEIRDAAGRVYPSQAKRLAPDFAFHPQVYRADGESVKLPKGTYTVRFERGPESIRQFRQIKVTGKQAETFKVQRWIDPAQLGWWSGDHHIHAAGCAHYNNPTEGVHAPDMQRHIMGEDLKVGSNLTWGPCFDYQKQFFTGKDDKVSQYPYLLRYDVEVSGFGSHRSGHLCLLRLKTQIYPGGPSKHHWPTLCLNTLRWAKKQGALVGPAHSGWGLALPTDDLPNYNIPPFDSIGANEYIMNVTHRIPGPGGQLVPAVDFLSMVDTPSVWELNIWYHTLNVGYRTRISGETDFPCIYGERVGLGRSYVKLDGKLNYNEWCEGIRAGRNYVGDGRSHLIDFQVNGAKMGVGDGELKLAKPGNVKVTFKAGAYLYEEPEAGIRERPLSAKPYWHIERARVGNKREVPVELIVNGQPVAKQMLRADGKLRDLTFNTKINRSSWVALRIYPSSHTNPVFVKVGDQPIRASRRSAEWCLKSLEQCWKQKEKLIAAKELPQARKDYDHARAAYRKIIGESFDDRN